jgi:hypothetical protein
MPDRFKRHASGLDSPARNAAPVTPDDNSDLPAAARSLYVGVTGDVRITTVGGDMVTFTGVPSGILPVRTARVHATGTTAAGIIAIW